LRLNILNVTVLLGQETLTNDLEIVSWFFGRKALSHHLDVLDLLDCDFLLKHDAIQPDSNLNGRPFAFRLFLQRQEGSFHDWKFDFHDLL
jgi:hypothetical protein